MPPIRTQKKNNASQAGVAKAGPTPTRARHNPPADDDDDNDDDASDDSSTLVKAAAQVQKAAKPKPVGKGNKNAIFTRSPDDWDGKYDTIIGTSTRKIIFGCGFKLAE
jgi:hypothetical protein